MTVTTGSGERLRELQERFTELPPPVEWATDLRRPAELGPDRHSAARTLPAELVAAMADVGDVPDQLVAAWAVLAVRNTAQRALLLGRHDGTSRTASFLELSFEPAAGFREAIDAVTATGNGADRPVDVDALAEALGLAGRRDRNPLFTITAGPVADDPTGSALPIPDLELRWEPRSVPERIEVLGAAELFSAARVERVADQFVTLLTALVAAPGVGFDTLDFCSPAEVELIASWQGDRRTPGDTHLGRRFSSAAATWPDRPAIEFDGTSWTYAEVDAWTNRLAAHLRGLGIGPDSVVAVRMDRSIELVPSIIAVLKAGGAYVPVDPAYPAARQAYMLEDAAATVILTRSDTVAADVATDATIIHVDDPDAAFLQGPDTALDPSGDGSHLGYVIYTSGSTGQPKAVALPRRALANLMDWQLASDGFAEGLRTLQFSSPSFDVSFQEMYSTLLSGGTLVLIDDLVRRDPRGLLDHIRRHAVERIFLPNVALRGLADAVASTGEAPKSLREVYTAGEQLRVDAVMRSLFLTLGDCRLENQYGPSETHVVTAYALPADPASWPVLPSIGRPISNSWAEVLDASGNRAPIGVPGELWLGGICLARGYLGKPEATTERFRPDPFRPGQTLYRTGDHVRWTEDGTLEFLGRLDQQVKFRGFRIEPSEIAAVIADADGVGQAAVAVRQADGGPARLVAYVELTDPAVSPAALRHLAADRLPDYMVPTHFVVLPKLPLTASGKVDTKALPAPDFDRSSLDTPYVAPRTETETALVQMWEALLQMKQVGVDDDFFDLGGDSLMAVELFSMLHDRFGVELPLGALAQTPTVAGLATAVDAARQGELAFDLLVPIRTSGSRRPLFCIHGGSGNVASFPRLARALGPDQPFYGVQWPGLATGDTGRSIPRLASRYIAEIKRIQPEGPYVLAGQCIGGLIAQEMSRQLVERGEQVDLVVMYDSPMLWSPNYTASGKLPAIPDRLRPVTNRGLSMAVAWLRFVKEGFVRRAMSPVQALRIRTRHLLRKPVEREDLFLHAGWALAALVWRHRPPVVDVPTVLIHSDEDNAGRMALTGHWDDGVLGWRHRLGPNFEAVYAEGGHNDLLYSPTAVAELQRRLDALDR